MIHTSLPGNANLRIDDSQDAVRDYGFPGERKIYFTAEVWALPGPSQLSNFRFALQRLEQI